MVTSREAASIDRGPYGPITLERALTDFRNRMTRTKRVVVAADCEARISRLCGAPRSATLAHTGDKN